MILNFALHSNRINTFEAMLKQECGWFDDPKNSVGALASRLSGDAANLQTVFFSRICFDVEAVGGV